MEFAKIRVVCEIILHGGRGRGGGKVKILRLPPPPSESKKRDMIHDIEEICSTVFFSWGYTPLQRSKC